MVTDFYHVVWAFSGQKVENLKMWQDVTLSCFCPFSLPRPKCEHMTQFCKYMTHFRCGIFCLLFLMILRFSLCRVKQGKPDKHRLNFYPPKKGLYNMAPASDHSYLKLLFLWNNVWQKQSIIKEPHSKFHCRNPITVSWTARH